MGIFFKSTCPLCWEREEHCTCSAEQLADYEEKKNNFVYKQLKKARYKGIELSENDRICAEIDGNHYIIIDFHENGCPIVELISNEANRDYTPKTWLFDKLYVIKASI